MRVWKEPKKGSASQIQDDPSLEEGKDSLGAWEHQESHAYGSSQV